MTRFPPGPTDLKTLRQLGQTNKQRLYLMQEIARHYGDIVHFQFWGRHYYLLNHPDYVHQVLASQPEYFHRTPGLKRDRRRIIDPTQTAQEMVDHDRLRRLIQPAFQATYVSRYADIMVRYTQDMLRDWRDGETRNIVSDMTDLTVKIVAKALFDADVSSKTDVIGDAIDRGVQYLSTLGKSLRSPIWLPTRQNRQLIRAWRGLDKTIKHIISQRRASNEDKGDLLSAILKAVDDDGGRLTEKEAYSTVLGLLIAGHETTATALTWIWYLLAQNLQALASLDHELDSVLKGKAPTVADLPQLPYTESVIREALRLYPPAYVVLRRVQSDVQIGDYTVPRNSTLFMSQYVLHRDARFYPNPEQFLPERWLDGSTKHMPRYAYFPFGGGPHVCTGQHFAWLEMQLLLVTMAQQYHLVVQPGQAVDPIPMMTLRPNREILMQANKR